MLLQDIWQLWLYLFNVNFCTIWQCVWMLHARQIWASSGEACREGFFFGVATIIIILTIAPSAGRWAYKQERGKSSDISNVGQQFCMTHASPVRPLRNFFMKEWHFHHTIWTRLSPHNMEVEIWMRKYLCFRPKNLHISPKTTQSLHIFFPNWSAASPNQPH